MAHRASAMHRNARDRDQHILGLYWGCIGIMEKLYCIFHWDNEKDRDQQVRSRTQRFLYLAARLDWNFEGALAAGFMFEGLLGPPELPNLMTDGLPLFGG